MLTPPSLSWKFRLFESEELTGRTREQNRWLKTASGKAITGNCTVYVTGREKEEKGVIHKAHDGSEKSPSESGYQESYSMKWTSVNSTTE